jgi:hypothetical protein
MSRTRFGWHLILVEERRARRNRGACRWILPATRFAREGQAVQLRRCATSFVEYKQGKNQTLGMRQHFDDVGVEDFGRPRALRSKHASSAKGCSVACSGNLLKNFCRHASSSLAVTATRDRLRGRHKSHVIQLMIRRPAFAGIANCGCQQSCSSASRCFSRCRRPIWTAAMAVGSQQILRPSARRRASLGRDDELRSLSARARIWPSDSDQARESTVVGTGVPNATAAERPPAGRA